uniref:Uncharacterized protein n=1 Tax=Arion vulgaris TaxID=1028688 RepID=A0A0B7A3B9_9EUPU
MIHVNTKAYLIRAISWPVLCYQCQTVSLTAANERKIITETRCIRRTARDQIINEKIERRRSYNSEQNNRLNGLEKNERRDDKETFDSPVVNQM